MKLFIIYIIENNKKMENQNISYRKLRNRKKTKVSKTSASLFFRKECSHRPKSGQNRRNEFSIMTQNVTRYEHMLKQPHIKENYIDWVVKLRGPIVVQTKKNDEVIPSVPSAYNKNTESRENFLKTKQISLRTTFNSADYYEILKRKCSNPHIQSHALQYITTLRDGLPNQTKFNEHKPKFYNIPYKDKKQLPTFLIKGAIKRTTNIAKNEKQSAFDGTHNFPPFSQKSLREKNYGLLCSFDKGKNKTSMPTLIWQMGLRS